MAQITIELQVTYSPAFHALVDCAELIAEQHGTDHAMAWAKRTLEADIDLFVRIERDRRPKLRLLAGGRE